jgi:hypothetical protein
MAQDWYYKLLGEETGPLTFRSLRELAADGHLTNSDEVRTSTSGWKTAGEIPELFQSGEVEEPELATGYDLDMLMSPSSAPVKVSDKWKALQAAKAVANAPQPQWYYKLLGQEMGPATTEEILEQIKNGSLHADDTVKEGPRGAWAPLEKTRQFAAAMTAMRPQPEWYCRVLGQELGPMTFDELEAMAKSGALNADDEVRHASEEWARADRTRGLKFAKVVAVTAASQHDRTSTYIPFGEDAKRKEWYYEILGQEMGPISFTEMLKAVSTGTLAFEDKARKGMAGAWNVVMDVPGLVSTDAKAAYLAAKQEASRPAPPPPAPVAAAASTAAPAIESPTRSVIPNSVPSRSVAPAMSTTSGSYSGNSSALGGSSYGTSSGYGSGMGGMSGSKAPPPPPVFKAPKKSSGPAFDFGAMFSGLKEIASPKAIGAVAAILLAGAMIYASQFGLSFGVAGKPEYAKVKEIFAKLNTAMSAGATPDLSAFNSENEKAIKSLKVSIEKQNPGSDRRLLQLMLFATRDHFPAIMANDATSAARFEMLKLEMAEAASLAGETP